MTDAQKQPKLPIVTRILKTAHDTIGQRAKDRDVQQERSMAATVKAFNAIHNTNLTEAQGWSFMTLLKMKRSFTGDLYREDDFIDETAYTALRAEAREAECQSFALTKAELAAAKAVAEGF